ncbi:MAG TPA: cellulase family glycosylhydrolase [Candidatus Hydrogenedentes bacterium]|nr:cellulase family glycosylhydrolase [Candidatus Hydrogenedentota bacterium]HPG67383.1 cellulase family glycosylhydrolase [Candidatus Hydrogenedentota bacterium]
MKRLESYSHLRGFNYQPSYGSHGLDTWGHGFDLNAIDRELGRGKQHFPKINTIRLWLSHDAFIRYGDEVATNFTKVVRLGDKYDLSFIAVLFNGWHSYPDFGGMSMEQLGWWAGEHFSIYREFLEHIVLPHAEDERILLWDLCNEPFNNARSDACVTTVQGWLEKLYGACKELGAEAPICVGVGPSMDRIRRVEPISDVITFHPYYAWNAWIPTPERFTPLLDEVVAFAREVGKSVVATETGWGALDDAKRCEILRVELSELAKRGIGFTAHLLHHTLVADGHRPGFGPITSAGYMAFVEADGSLRPGHEIFNEF